VKYLVDVNVLSEPMKAAPSLQVIQWLKANERQLAVDPVIISEIRLGINLMSDGKRKRALDEWFTRGIANLVCIPIDMATGLRWAQLLARLREDGQTMPLKDSLIAATALTHGLTVVTRNVKDFEKAGVEMLNPFDSIK